VRVARAKGEGRRAQAADPPTRKRYGGDLGKMTHTMRKEVRDVHGGGALTESKGVKLCKTCTSLQNEIFADVHDVHGTACFVNIRRHFVNIRRQGAHLVT
jgi:hypothetical protein